MKTARGWTDSHTVRLPRVASHRQTFVSNTWPTMRCRGLPEECCRIDRRLRREGFCDSTRWWPTMRCRGQKRVGSTEARGSVVADDAVPRAARRVLGDRQPFASTTVVADDAVSRAAKRVLSDRQPFAKHTVVADDAVPRAARRVLATSKVVADDRCRGLPEECSGIDTVVADDAVSRAARRPPKDRHPFASTTVVADDAPWWPEGCQKSARGSTSFCKAHGGARRCGAEGCQKSAAGSIGFCRPQ